MKIGIQYVVGSNFCVSFIDHVSLLELAQLRYLKLQILSHLKS